MKYIKQVKIRATQAKKLQHMGFKLKLVAMHLDGLDTYNIYVKGA